MSRLLLRHQFNLSVSLWSTSSTLVTILVTRWKEKLGEVMAIWWYDSKNLLKSCFKKGLDISPSYSSFFCFTSILDPSFYSRFFFFNMPCKQYCEAQRFLILISHLAVGRGTNHASKARTGKALHQQIISCTQVTKDYADGREKFTSMSVINSRTTEAIRWI